MGLIELMRLGEMGCPKDETGRPKDLSKGNSRITEIADAGGVLTGKYRSTSDEGTIETRPFETEYVAGQERDIFEWAERNNIVAYKGKRGNEVLTGVLMYMVLPVLAFVVMWIFLMRQFQSGSSKAMSFGKSRARLVSEGQVKVTFEDVAGIDEVKEELVEIIQFLKDPKRFSRLGAKIPKGALLSGPPGTGKTLIARAVAGEASVPFFSISGSDFVEMFVGVGASRVRDLFEQGKKARPCLIFIDEIDAVGRHRFAGIGGGHDEREQTLNQLLVELDGFQPNEGVIVMASTNRPDVLDPALLRPGRFDRQIRVDLPDLLGREKILQVHTRQIKISPKVDLRTIARGTPGFSGADLANLANEAALLAGRRGKNLVEMDDMEEAKDRVLMGPERRSMVLSEKERENTAYHEAGHALVGMMTEGNEDKVHKVTIIPRGWTLGATSVLPEEDRHNRGRKQLVNAILLLMGGRAAEEIQFEEFTTGASNDLQRATAIAHRMVCEFGMSERLGPRTFGSSGSAQVFLGRDMGRERDYSEETAGVIDAEVQKILKECYERAKDLVLAHRDAFGRIGEALLERETLDSDELRVLIEGGDLPPLFKDDGSGPGFPQGSPDEQSSQEREKRPISGPILTPPTTQPS
ncbi:ATP-dependent zinc metalloprotease FtsH [Candidatus Sumerlaeota bacterium]|nr:ATP-dependent zinc metalloprotease FtsH [Candidatus Sumerlaeota bacterium]